MTPEDIIMESEGTLEIGFIKMSTSAYRRMRAERREYSRWDPRTGNVTLYDLEKGAPRTVCTWTILSCSGSAGEWRHPLLPRGCDDVRDDEH